MRLSNFSLCVTFRKVISAPSVYILCRLLCVNLYRLYRVIKTPVLSSVDGNHRPLHKRKFSWKKEFFWKKLYSEQSTAAS